MRGRLSASLLLVAAVGSTPALAAPPLVVVPGTGEPPAPVARALGVPARPLSRAEAWRLVREARAHHRLAQARQAVEEGRRAVTRLRLEQAERALREALGHFAAAQLLPEACPGAHDAARDLSFLFWQRKQLDPARRWRAAAAGLAAQIIDPTRYPPEFVAFWNASEENPAAIPITVTVKPGPTAETAETSVNCRAVGSTPAAVSVAGAALVALARDVRAAGMVVAPDRSELYEIPLPPAAPELSAEDAAELVKATGAPALFWVKRDAGDWVIDRFVLANAWQRSFRRVATRSTRPIERKNRGRDRPAVLGWVLSGAAAAALVSGVVTAVLAKSAADEIERKAAEDELFDPADEEANRRYRTASYTTLAVGGALTAAAVVYWVWRARRRDAHPPAAGLELRGDGLALRW